MWVVLFSLLSVSYLGWRTLRAQRPSEKAIQLSAPSFIIADSMLEVCLVSRAPAYYGWTPEF